MKSSELSNGENRIALRQFLQNRKLRHLWCHNLGSRWKLQKMTRENVSIGAFYNITKNHDNPIKTVGRGSFLRPKTPKNTSFLGSPSPYILGDTTRPRHITYVLVWSKSDQRRLRKTLHKQTNRQTDKPTETTKIMVTWLWTNIQSKRRHKSPVNPCKSLEHRAMCGKQGRKHGALRMEPVGLVTGNGRVDKWLG